MLGQTVSHYRIEALLGEGAAGTVYRATDLNLPDHNVAIKALKPSSEDDRQAYQRFLREARALVQIEHLNVVDLHEVVEQDGRQFLVMQYVEGETLRQVLSGGRLDVDRALDLATQMADGLAAAHEGQVVHRDVKPENITITGQGRVKIMDFGIARHVERTQLTMDGALLGTIPYMAPEQIEGGEITVATDVYALGVVLYEMLTGRLPFQADTRRRLMHLVLDGEPTPLRKLRPDLSATLCESVHRCLRKAPGERFTSMTQLGDALRSIRSGGSATEVLPRLTRRRRHLWMRRVIPAGVLILAFALMVSQIRSPRTGPAEQPRIMVLPFENESAGEDMDWLAGAISDVLVAQLNQLGEYQVVSSQTVASALQHLEVRQAGVNLNLLREVADRVGARYLLAGSYTKSPPGTRLSCELTDLADDISVGRWSHTVADLDLELLANVRRLAREVAMSLDEEFGADSKRVELTSSVAALHHFQRGEQRFKEADYPGAYQEFELAVAIDTTFAAAHRWLADLARDESEAELHLNHAMRFRDRYLPPLPQLVEAEFYWQQGYVELAARTYERVVSEYPLQVHAQRSLANLYLHMRRFEDASAAFERVRQNDPYDYSVIPVWWLALFELEEEAHIERILRAWRREEPAEPAAMRTLIRYHQAVGEYQLALAECDTLDRLASGTDRAFRGFLLLDLGRIAAARAIFEEMRDHPDPHFPALRARVYLAQTELRAGNHDEALAHVTAALEEVDDVYSHYVAGKVAVAAGRTDLARAHAAAIARGIPGDLRDDSMREAFSERGWYFELTGDIALTEGDAAQAIDELETALPFAGRTAAPRIRAELATARRTAGQLAEATREAGAALAVNPHHPPSLLEMGRARLELGDTAQARATLAQLDDLWSKADENFPPRQQLDALLARTMR